MILEFSVCLFHFLILIKPKITDELKPPRTINTIVITFKNISVLKFKKEVSYPKISNPALLNELMVWKIEMPTISIKL